VQRLTASFADRIVTGQPVRQIRRGEDGVHLHLDGSEQRFDHVVIATHADQALALLAMPIAPNDGFWVLSAIAAMRRCCMPTRVSCPKGGASGRAGIMPRRAGLAIPTCRSPIG
jgi:hypothetical protein